MNRIHVSTWLRWGLSVDAVASALFGLSLTLFASPLAQLFQLPAIGLFAVGLFCLLYAAIIGRMAPRERLPSWAVWTVVIGNLVWAVDSVLLVALDIVSPNPWGQAMIYVQAAVVVGLAEWQYFGLRRSQPIPHRLVASI
ncbi:hypothetical protein [Pseudomarimonas arenosa]|uniref:Integral membrane protein n=1 Tax=Pseudomarimonas arenosa TaxID=2774145 RepID=A0AAW3ZS53_9GAMM|nr:hypothetical protein [Pseudomarimonas arenosa]MBD8527347.1 hypothetical protein [Pseudomarimonas arenosa]